MQSEGNVPRDAPVQDRWSEPGNAGTDAISGDYPGFVAWLRKRARDLGAVLRRSPDILLLFASVVVLPLMLVLPLTYIRVPLAVALVLFAPGYALVAALLPLRDEASWAVRLGLSFGMSVAAIPLIALALDLLAIAILPVQIALSLSLWILMMSVMATLRRAKAKTEEPGIDLSVRPLFHSGSEWIRARPRIAIPFAAALVAVSLIALFLFVTQPNNPPTEFYILGDQGQARDYPREVTAGRSVVTSVGVVNKGSSAQEYLIEVWTSDPGAAQPTDEVASVGPIEVDAGATFEDELSWKMPRPGEDQRVTLLLYRSGEAAPYRRLQLVLDVADFPALTDRGTQ